MSARWQYLIPQITLTHAMRLLGNARVPLIKNNFIKWFIRRYGVDMSLAVEPDYRAYSTFNDFFTRRLRKEVRPQTLDAQQLMCPVDGSVSEFGAIENQQLLQAKGIQYSLSALLAGRSDWARHFAQGQFITLYLSPRDYHRIHMPATGQLEAMQYVPGKLFSVNQATVNSVPGVFARNERIINLFKTEHGHMVVIFVGALVVGSMATRWEGLVTPMHRGQPFVKQYHNVACPQGDEIGYFQMGSTVIVLLEQPNWQWNQSLQVDGTVVMGQSLATIGL